MCKLPLRFEYTEDIEPPNRGFRVDEMKAYLGMIQVGYLKVEYVPKVRYKEFLPTIFHYLRSYAGWTGVPIEGSSKPDLTSVALWRYLLGHGRGFSWHYYNGEAPPVEQRIKDIEMIVKEKKPALLTFKRWHVDKPRVAYVRVFDGRGWPNEPAGFDYRRKGIGTALYVATANKLAEQGFPGLYASTCQSDAAKLCWDSMRSREFPIIKQRTPDKVYRYILLGTAETKTPSA